jgi:serine/threonine-protein kinase
MADVFDRLNSAFSDRYRIERELGSGGSATVYLAEDLKHKSCVAGVVFSVTDRMGCPGASL